jgi:hypothetical protein
MKKKILTSILLASLNSLPINVNGYEATLIMTKPTTYETGEPLGNDLTDLSVESRINDSAPKIVTKISANDSRFCNLEKCEITFTGFPEGSTVHFRSYAFVGTLMSEPSNTASKTFSKTNSSQSTPIIRNWNSKILLDNDFESLIEFNLDTKNESDSLYDIGYSNKLSKSLSYCINSEDLFVTTVRNLTTGDVLFKKESNSDCFKLEVPLNYGINNLEIQTVNEQGFSNFQDLRYNVKRSFDVINNQSDKQLVVDFDENGFWDKRGIDYFNRLISSSNSRRFYQNLENPISIDINKDSLEVRISNNLDREQKVQLQLKTNNGLTYSLPLNVKPQANEYNLSLKSFTRGGSPFFYDNSSKNSNGLFLSESDEIKQISISTPEIADVTIEKLEYYRKNE